MSKLARWCFQHRKWVVGLWLLATVAVVGFSAGGHLSYLAACRLPVSRTAVLYGGWLPGTDIPMSQPTPTLDLTPGITGRILYLAGEDDALIDAGQREQIRTALASLEERRAKAERRGDTRAATEATEAIAARQSWLEEAERTLAELSN